MLIFERVDFTGSTEDVTDGAEGMRSVELKHNHVKLVLREVLRTMDFYRRTKKPAYNLRFGAMAAVTRMKGRYEFEKPCAAESALEAATAPSRWVVVSNARECSRRRKMRNGNRGAKRQM
jgi:hypothetical protein